MKLTHLKYGFVAMLALVAVAALIGHPLIPTDLLASVGMAGPALFMIGEISPVEEIKSLIEDQGRSIVAHHQKTDARFKQLETDFQHLEARRNRPGVGTSADDELAMPKNDGWVDAKSGKPVIVMKHGQALAKPQHAGETPSIGRVLRGLCLGGTAPDAAELAEERKAMSMSSDPAGGYTVTAIGAPTAWDFVLDGMYELMLDNVPAERIGALVAHPAVWKKMAKLKTGISNDKTTLPMPAEVATVPKLWTTAAPLVGGATAAGIIADWRDLIFGVRQQITVKVLQEAFLGSNLQLAVLAYARVDFGAARSASFCTLEGITV